MSWEELDAKMARLRAWMNRTMRYYDDAPDGSPKKQWATETMAEINEKIRAVEAEQEALFQKEENGS